jgi:hypothetical protein
MPLGFLEKRQFFAENRQKLQKIVIITTTPDLFVKKRTAKIAKKMGSNQNISM